MVVARGASRGAEGRVVQVYRKKWVVHLERLQKEKSNGATVPIPIHRYVISFMHFGHSPLTPISKTMIARKSGKSVEEIQA